MTTLLMNDRSSVLQPLRADASGVECFGVSGRMISLRAASGKLGDSEFTLEAYTGGFLKLPEFIDYVVINLDNASAPGPVPIIRDHEYSRPVGQADNIKIANNISGTGVILREFKDSPEILDTAAKDFEWQLSVGGAFPMDLVEYVPTGNSRKINGQVLQGPFYVVNEFVLKEITVVSVGADLSRATATLVAAFKNKATKSRTDQGESSMGFEAWLKTLGLELASLSEAAVAKLKTQFEAEQKAAEDDGDSDGDSDSGDADGNQKPPEKKTESGSDPAARIAEDAAKEIERVQALQSLTASFTQVPEEKRTEILTAALRDRSTTRDRLELQLLRASYPTPVQGKRRSGGDDVVDLKAALVGAVMLRCSVDIDSDRLCSKQAKGLGTLSAAFTAPVNSERRQRWMEAAFTKYRNHSIVDLVKEAMRMEGNPHADGLHYRDKEFLKAAFSSSAVTDLFTTSFSAIMMDSYMSMENVAFPFVKEVDVPNYLLNERKRLQNGGAQLEKLRDKMEPRDAYLTSTGESYRISDYARRFIVSDQDLINDRFDVLDESAPFFGRAAASMLPLLVFDLIASNPNMADGSAWFNSTAGNLATTTAFTDANVQTAITAMKKMQEGSETLTIVPTHALLPVALEWSADKLLNSALVVSGNTTPAGNTNPLQNKFKPIYDARLDNGFLDPDDLGTSVAGDGTTWYLFDSRYPAIECGHLLGTNRTVEITSGPLANGAYGTWISAKRSLGVAPIRRASARKHTA